MFWLVNFYCFVYAFFFAFLSSFFNLAFFRLSLPCFFALNRPFVPHVTLPEEHKYCKYDRADKAAEPPFSACGMFRVEGGGGWWCLCQGRLFIQTNVLHFFLSVHQPTQSSKLFLSCTHRDLFFSATTLRCNRNYLSLYLLLEYVGRLEHYRVRCGMVYFSGSFWVSFLLIMLFFFLSLLFAHREFSPTLLTTLVSRMSNSKR